MSSILAKRTNLIVPFTGAFIILLPVVFSASTIDPVLMPRFIILSTFVVGLCALFIREKVNILPRSYFSSSWFWANLVFLAGSLLSGLNATNQAEYIYTNSFQILLFALMLALIQVLFKHDNAVRVITRCFVLAGLTISAIALFQIFQSQLSFNADHELLHLVKSSLGHKNLLASGLLILLPFWVYISITHEGKWRWLSMLSILLFLALIYFVKARSAYLGLAVGILLFAVSGWIARIPKHLLNALALVFAFGLISWFTYQYINFSKDDEQKIAIDIQEDNERTFTIYERELLWNATLNMAFEESFIGVGAGNWKIEFPKYGSEIWRARQGLVQFQRPHNDFFWVLSEAGILSASGYLLVFLFIIIIGLQNIKRSSCSHERLLNKLIIAGIAAYVIVANFSFPKERVFHQVVLHTFFAIVIAARIKTQTEKSSWPISSIVALIIAAASFSIGISRFNGEGFSKALMAFRAKSQWPKILDGNENHERSPFYSIDPMAMPVDFYVGLAQLENSNVEESVNTFNRAKQAHPNNVHVLNNLGSNHQLLGNLDSAVFYYNRVVSMAPYYMDGILNLAAVHFNNGQVDLAYRVLAEYETKFEEDRELYESYLTVILNTMLLNLAEQATGSADAENLKKHDGDTAWLLQCHEQSVQEPRSVISVMIQNSAATAK